jgi:hypothetical protein
VSGFDRVSFGGGGGGAECEGCERGNSWLGFLHFQNGERDSDGDG